MPGATPSIEKANRMLSGSGSDAQSDVLAAVTGEASILEAIDNIQFLADIEESLANEVRAVLAALPEPVDRALLAGIKGAVSSEMPVSLSWMEADEIGVRVSESGRDQHCAEYATRLQVRELDGPP